MELLLVTGLTSAITALLALVLLRARGRQRRRVAAELSLTRARTRAGFARAGLTMFAVGRDGTITWFEGAPLPLEDGDRLAVLGAPAADALAGWPSVAADVRVALAGEKQRRRLEAGRRAFEVESAPRFGDDGRIQEALVTARDVTREEQEARRAAELAAVRSRMVAVMNYRLRSQLTAVLGALDLIEGDVLDEAGRGWLTTAEEATRRLATFVQHLVGFIELDAEQRNLVAEPFSLRTSVELAIEAVAATAAARDATLIQRYPPRLLEDFSGDELLVREVLTLLLDVAVRTNSHGQVLLNVEERLREPDLAMLALSIEDSGEGLSERARERMFLGFESESALWANRSGISGLELPLARRLVDLLGGELAVESATGVGTAFRVELTLRRAAAVERAQRGRPGPEDRARRILLVDDSDVQRAVAAALLGRLGHHVLAAGSGEEALRLLEAEHVDLVLTELDMPNVDGFDLAERARSGPAEPRPAVVALTADNSSAAVYATQQAGFAGFVVKPVTGADLRRALAPILEARPADTGEALRFDWAALEQLLATAPDGPEVVAQLAAALRDAGPRLLLDLEDARSAPVEDRERSFHLLTASARLLGAVELVESAREYEAAMRGEDASRARDAYQAVVRAFERTSELLQERARSAA